MMHPAVFKICPPYESFIEMCSSIMSIISWQVNFSKIDRSKVSLESEHDDIHKVFHTNSRLHIFPTIITNYQVSCSFYNGYNYFLSTKFTTLSFLSLFQSRFNTFSPSITTSTATWLQFSHQKFRCD